MDGEIRSVRLSDEFRILNDAVEKLDEATTILHLVERAAEWTERRDKGGFKPLSEVFGEQGASAETNGGGV